MLIVNFTHTLLVERHIAAGGVNLTLDQYQVFNACFDLLYSHMNEEKFRNEHMSAMVWLAEVILEQHDPDKKKISLFYPGAVLIQEENPVLLEQWCVAMGKKNITVLFPLR